VLHVSQDSVATYLKCGGIFNDRFITGLRPSLMTKEFSQSNLSAFGEVMDKNILALSEFDGHWCVAWFS